MSALTNKRPLLTTTLTLSAQTVAKRIGIPLSKWSGNCFAIATALVHHKLVEGTAVYGHWLGPVAEGTRFYNKGIIHHGWVLKPDEVTVVDPTRWVFEGAKPYIFQGTPSDCGDFTPSDESDRCSPDYDPLAWPRCETCNLLASEHGKWPYDEGGNQLRSAMIGRAPSYKRGDATLPWKPKNSRLANAVDILLDNVKRKPGKLTKEQLSWLANLPYDMLMPLPGLNLAPDLYKELKKLGMLARVPIDNQRRAARKVLK